MIRGVIWLLDQRLPIASYNLCTLTRAIIIQYNTSRRIEGVYWCPMLPPSSARAPLYHSTNTSSRNFHHQFPKIHTLYLSSFYLLLPGQLIVVLFHIYQPKEDYISIYPILAYGRLIFDNKNKKYRRLYENVTICRYLNGQNTPSQPPPPYTSALFNDPPFPNREFAVLSATSPFACPIHRMQPCTCMQACVKVEVSQDIC